MNQDVKKLKLQECLIPKGDLLQQASFTPQTNSLKWLLCTKTCHKSQAPLFRYRVILVGCEVIVSLSRIDLNVLLLEIWRATCGFSTVCSLGT